MSGLVLVPRDWVKSSARADHQFSVDAMTNLRFEMHPVELALRVPLPHDPGCCVLDAIPME